MNKLSFFGKKYDFSYFFFLDKNREDDIADKDFKISDISEEKISVYNDVISKVESLEVFINLVYPNYKFYEKSTVSTMRDFDTHIIDTIDFCLELEFNLSILSRVSRLRVKYFQKSGGLRICEAFNIVEMDKILDFLLYQLSYISSERKAE